MNPCPLSEGNMLIQFRLKSFLFSILIFLFIPIPPEEGIFSQVLKSSTQQSKFNYPLLSVEGEKFINCVDVQDSIRLDTALSKTSGRKFRMKRSPWLAVGLSALLPGAGQFYNKSYWKVPIVLGLIGYLGYQYYDNDKKYRDYRDQYSATQTPENPTGDLNLKILRQFYFDQRNDFVWYFAIVYVINLVDAYVDAHLFDFDVKEEKLTRFGVNDKEYKLNVRFRISDF
jgi:hypothetical protein